VSEPARITLLSRGDCGFCDHAKRVLARVGARYPLQVTEISLDSREGQAIATRAGVLFAPGVLVDDRPFSFGRLPERKLLRTLEKRALQPDDQRSG
jgi:glutaredoxin